VLAATAVLTFTFGLITTTSIGHAVGITSILWTAEVSVYTWLQKGARGIPIAATMSCVAVLYYGAPILEHATFLDQFDESEVMDAGLTCAGFFLVLVIAAMCGRQIVARKQFRRVEPKAEYIFIPAVGVGVGVLYQIAVAMNVIGLFGSMFSTVRAIATAICLVSAFLVGGVLGRKANMGGHEIIGVALIGTYTVLCWTSLLLVQGAIALGTVLAGYCVSARRIPILTVVAVVAVITVLSAGKSEMRERYWGRMFTPLEAPALMAEWLDEGYSKIVRGEGATAAMSRTSLLQIVLKVRRLSPDVLPFLYGETYLMAPRNVIPRVIAADKSDVHEGTIRLAVYYEVQTYEGAQYTSFAMGLVAEAYANFGWAGVVVVGGILGLLVGMVEGLSEETETVSFRMLFAINLLALLINPEVDSGTLAASVFQSTVGVAMLTVATRWWVRRGRLGITVRMA